VNAITESPKGNPQIICELETCSRSSARPARGLRRFRCVEVFFLARGSEGSLGLRIERSTILAGVRVRSAAHPDALDLRAPRESRQSRASPPRSAPVPMFRTARRLDLEAEECYPCPWTLGCLCPRPVQTKTTATSTVIFPVG